jgi:hypothetical protein
MSSPRWVVTTHGGASHAPSLNRQSFLRYFPRGEGEEQCTQMVTRETASPDIRETVVWQLQRGGTQHVIRHNAVWCAYLKSLPGQAKDIRMRSPCWKMAWISAAMITGKISLEPAVKQQKEGCSADCEIDGEHKEVALTQPLLKQHIVQGNTDCGD